MKEIPKLNMSLVMLGASIRVASIRAGAMNYDIDDVRKELKLVQARFNELEEAIKPRPIESAPKDGTWFLGWKGLWVIVAWDNSLEEFINDDYESQRSLTHWLPLPTIGGVR